MRIAIATVAETRRVEGEHLEQWGMPELVLMERAALGVALQVCALAEPGGSVRVVAGCGNNGADGIAAARILRAWGYDPTVYQLPGTGTDSHRQQLAWADHWGVRVRPFERASDLPTGAVVVDGVFGFGLNRAPEGIAREAIEAMNGCGAEALVAIDLPSGLDGTTGVAPGAVVHATHTVAAGLLKSGLLTDPALAAVGRLVLADIGFAPSLLEALPGHVLAPLPMPARPLATHKGEAGSLLVVGGSAAMSGAPGLVARAAGRVGAGLVYVAVPMGIRETVAAQMPEAVVFGLPEDEAGGLAAAAWEQLSELMGRCKAGVLGPGLARGPEAMRLAQRWYHTWQRPLVVDADALQPDLLDLTAAGPRLLTPHPGEAGRLLGISVPAVQADRIAQARTLAEKARALTILKGARTVVAEPAGSYGVNVLGTPAMATAGSGDVLAGVLGGLLAQGLDPLFAAQQGVVLHGLAGLVATGFGERSTLLASDLLASLAEALGLVNRPAPPGAPLLEIGRFEPNWPPASASPRK